VALGGGAEVAHAKLAAELAGAVRGSQQLGGSRPCADHGWSEVLGVLSAARNEMRKEQFGAEDWSHPCSLPPHGIEAVYSRRKFLLGARAGVVLS